MSKNYDVVIVGAGAAGMMCAAIAGQYGKRVLVLDHAKKIGEKIRISGGGRCNFTNIHTTAVNFLSKNPHFAKSALKRYAPQDFIQLVKKYDIAWHEKTLGQLFCDGSAKQIVDLLLNEMQQSKVTLMGDTTIEKVTKTDTGFVVKTSQGAFECNQVVVACGGKSIPKIGATGFGFEIAKQFDLNIVETAPALVPLTFANADLDRFKELAGVSVPVRISCGMAQFDEDLLFTHRGLSGPAVLQISSFWNEKLPVQVQFTPNIDFESAILAAKQQSGRRGLASVLGELLPKRLASALVAQYGYLGNIADLNREKIAEFVFFLSNYTVFPTGTEGYRTAEVTRGGVDTDHLSAKTFETKSVPGLYFIGEVVDVTGWLGGYNFQWAWASGHAAGTAIGEKY